MRETPGTAIRNVTHRPRSECLYLRLFGNRNQCNGAVQLIVICPRTRTERATVVDYAELSVSHIPWTRTDHIQQRDPHVVLAFTNMSHVVTFWGPHVGMFALCTVITVPSLLCAARV